MNPFKVIKKSSFLFSIQFHIETHHNTEVKATVTSSSHALQPTDQMMRNINSRLEECVRRKLSTHRRMNRCPEENTAIIHPHGLWKEREKRGLGQAYSYFDMTSRAGARENGVCTCVPR